MDIYQVKVTLQYIQPSIWRRIEVPSDIRLGKLHTVLQAVMGWTNSHMHQFLAAGIAYGTADPGGELDIRSERSIRLDGIAEEGGRLMYEYDFGDSWEHGLLIEKRLQAVPGAHYPRCLAGKRACPPEDCGGVGGYGNLLAILADPGHEEYEEMLEWLGGGYDPEAFDLDAVNRWLRRIKLAPTGGGQAGRSRKKKPRTSK